MVNRTYEVGELTRSEVFQRNERIKALSGLCKTFGTALVIAGAGRWFYAEFDGYTIFWFVIGAMLLWSSLHILTLLEAES
jgi:hypothetical protein